MESFIKISMVIRSSLRVINLMSYLFLLAIRKVTGFILYFFLLYDWFDPIFSLLMEHISLPINWLVPLLSEADAVLIRYQRSRLAGIILTPNP